MDVTDQQTLSQADFMVHCFSLMQLTGRHAIYKVAVWVLRSPSKCFICEPYPGAKKYEIPRRINGMNMTNKRKIHSSAIATTEI